MVEYLGLEDIASIHHETMERLGEIPQPLTRYNDCLAALDRPRWAAHYEGADIMTQAARLAVGLVKAHAFVDGNKRTAYRSLEVFLALNGFRIRGDMLDLAYLLEHVANQEAAEGDVTLEAWLREHVFEDVSRRSEGQPRGG